MFKLGDTVRFRKRLGKIDGSKAIKLKDLTGMDDYILYKVEFEFDSFEWINENYLSKIYKVN
jgi:hypothetical protein